MTSRQATCSLRGAVRAFGIHHGRFADGPVDSGVGSVVDPVRRPAGIRGSAVAIEGAIREAHEAHLVAHRVVGRRLVSLATVVRVPDAARRVRVEDHPARLRDSPLATTTVAATTALVRHLDLRRFGPAGTVILRSDLVNSLAVLRVLYDERVAGTVENGLGIRISLAGEEPGFLPGRPLVLAGRHDHSCIFVVVEEAPSAAACLVAAGVVAAADRKKMVMVVAASFEVRRADARARLHIVVGKRFLDFPAARQRQRVIEICSVLSPGLLLQNATVRGNEATVRAHDEAVEDSVTVATFDTGAAAAACAMASRISALGIFLCDRRITKRQTALEGHTHCTVPVLKISLFCVSGHRVDASAASWHRGGGGRA